MNEALIGLKLEEAMALARLEGIEPRIRFSDVPFFTVSDLINRIPRVVRAEGGELLVSHFREKNPEA